MSDTPRMSDERVAAAHDCLRELCGSLQLGHGTPPMPSRLWSYFHECERARAAEDDLRRELAASEAIVVAQAELCQLLIAEFRAAVRLTRGWQERCEQAEARREAAEGALRECQALAQDSDCPACSEVWLIADALLGEDMPHA